MFCPAMLVNRNPVAGRFAVNHLHAKIKRAAIDRYGLLVHPAVPEARDRFFEKILHE